MDSGPTNNIRPVVPECNCPYRILRIQPPAQSAALRSVDYDGWQKGSLVLPLDTDQGRQRAARTARRLTGRRLFRNYYRHRAIFCRSVETPPRTTWYEAPPRAIRYGAAASFFSDFFIAVRLLRRREQFTEPDFALLARPFNRAPVLQPFWWPVTEVRSISQPVSRRAT